MTRLLLLAYPSESGRHFSVDLARTLAVVGMLLLHAVPASEISASSFLSEVVGHNRPQLLFAVLDGVSVGFITQSAIVDPLARVTARRAVSIRGITLIALGLFLSTLNSGVIVILDYYGFFLLLLLPFLFLSKRTLAISAASLAVVGPSLIYLFGLASSDILFAMPLQPILTWLVWGQYPALIWMAYVIFGLVIARVGFTNVRTVSTLLACLVAVSFGLQFIVTDDGSLLDQTCRDIQSGTFAGALILTSVVLTRGVRGRWSLVLRPAVAMGILPLSVYTLHVVVVSLSVGLDGVARYQSAGSFGVLLLICAVFAAVWASLFRRGPLEAWIHWMCKR